jgi:hypothetical protein
MLLFFRALFSFPCLCQRVNKNPFLYSLRARPANPTRTTNPMHQRCPLSMLLLHATATWALRPAEAHLSDGFLNPASPCFAPRAHRRRESRGSPHPDNAVTALDHWPLAPSPCSTVSRRPRRLLAPDAQSRVPTTTCPHLPLCRVADWPLTRHHAPRSVNRSRQASAWTSAIFKSPACAGPLGAFLVCRTHTSLVIVVASSAPYHRPGRPFFP